MGYHVHFQVAQLQPTNCLDHMPTALSYHRKNPPQRVDNKQRQLSVSTYMITLSPRMPQAACS